VSVEERRAALVELLTAACAPVPVCDDEPDLVTTNAAVIVAWERTARTVAQWEHTYHVTIVVTRSADASPAIAARDRLLGIVLTQLDAASGLNRPSAEIAPADVGGVIYPRCAVVTITATDAPVST
jgi:hypothetical protein